MYSVDPEPCNIPKADFIETGTQQDGKKKTMKINDSSMQVTSNFAACDGWMIVVFKGMKALIMVAIKQRQKVVGISSWSRIKQRA